MKTLMRYAVALLGVVVILNSCGVKPDSVGEFDEIYVFCDSLDWQDYRGPLNDLFGKEFRMPAAEREFVLKWRPFDKFEFYNKYRNVILIGRLNGTDDVSKVIQNSLAPEVVTEVEKGNAFYIPKHDVWAMGQYVLFLVAPNKDKIVSNLYDFGDAIYKDFKASYYRRLKQFMFARYENKDLEAYIARHFPFTLRVQHDYFIATESLDSGYVWLRRLNPDRSLTIHWTALPDTVTITPRWIIDERNRLGQWIYNGDVIVEEETRGERFEFKGYPAYRLEGTWKNPKLVIGGPFRNITFVDKDNNMVFMIDYYVFAPGKRKRVFLDQLEIMAYTFHVNYKKQQGAGLTQ